MKLYAMAPQDCSGKVRWLLLELGLPFENIYLSHKNGDFKTDAYLAKQPLGQVPVLEDGPVTMFESQAIVAYLADKYGDKGLAPDPKNFEQRASYYQWLAFSTNSADAFFGKFQRLSKMSEEYRNEWGPYIQAKTIKVMAAIENQLKGRDYILGSFSAVDCALGYSIDGIAEEKFLGDFPLTRAYYERLSKREACVKSEIFKR